MRVPPPGFEYGLRPSSASRRVMNAVRADREIGRSTTARAALRRRRPASRCAAPPSRAAARSVSNIARRSMSRKSCVTWPTHDDRAKSGVFAGDLDLADALGMPPPQSGRRRHAASSPSGTRHTRTSRCRRAARLSYNVAQLRHERIEHVDVRVGRRRIPVRRLARRLEQRHVVGRLGTALARRLGLADDLLEPLGWKVRARHRATRRPMIEITDSCASSASPLVVTVLCAHRMLTLGDSPRNHDARIGLRQAQHAIDGFLEGDQCPSCAVLRMLTCRNSAAGHPCVTGAIWPGCPLPQLNAPPSTYVDGPPTASIEFQKSVVRD